MLMDNAARYGRKRTAYRDTERAGCKRQKAKKDGNNYKWKSKKG